MKNYTSEEIKKILKIEECINSIETKKNSVLYKLCDDSYGINDEDMEKIKKIMDDMDTRADIEMVEKHLRLRGYVKKSGKLDYARFQDEACITQSVWSRYINQKQSRTDQDTLLKIVLGLRLNEEDAHKYMGLAGSEFAIGTNYTDKIILSYIKADYLGDVETVDIVHSVDFLLNFYSEQETEAGRSPLPKFYKF